MLDIRPNNLIITETYEVSAGDTISYWSVYIQLYRDIFLNRNMSFYESFSEDSDFLHLQLISSI